MAKKKGAAELFIAAIGVMVLLALFLIAFIIFPVAFVNLANNLTGNGVSTGAPTLAISGLPSQLNVSPDSSYTLPVVVSLVNGSNAPITLGAAGLPPWLNVSFTKRAGVTPFETNITFTVSERFNTTGAFLISRIYYHGSTHNNIIAPIEITGGGVFHMNVDNILPVLPYGGPNTFSYITGASLGPLMTNISTIQQNSTVTHTAIANRYTEVDLSYLKAGFDTTSTINTTTGYFPLESKGPLTGYGSGYTYSVGIGPVFTSSDYYNVTVTYMFSNGKMFTIYVQNMII